MAEILIKFIYIYFKFSEYVLNRCNSVQCVVIWFWFQIKNKLQPFFWHFEISLKKKISIYMFLVFILLYFHHFPLFQILYKINFRTINLWLKYIYIYVFVKISSEIRNDFRILEVCRIVVSLNFCYLKEIGCNCLRFLWFYTLNEKRVKVLCILWDIMEILISLDLKIL